MRNRTRSFAREHRGTFIMRLLVTALVWAITPAAACPPWWLYVAVIAFWTLCSWAVYLRTSATKKRGPFGATP